MFNFNRKRFTYREFKELLNSIVVLVDTREQKIRHLTEVFDDTNINFQKQKLNFGDYSAKIPKNPELGIEEEINFKEIIAIERKNGLEELSSNLCYEDERFINELKRAKKKKTDFWLLIEEGNGYKELVMNNYETDYQPKHFESYLLTLVNRYDVKPVFVSKRFSARFIYKLLYYKVKTYLESKN